MTEDSYLNFTPVKLDALVDSTTISMHTTLNHVPPLKRKVISQMRHLFWHLMHAQDRRLDQREVSVLLVSLARKLFLNRLCMYELD